MSIQNEILNAIASRRSCRAYEPEQITAEELEAVTARHRQIDAWMQNSRKRQKNREYIEVYD